MTKKIAMILGAICMIVLGFCAALAMLGYVISLMIILCVVYAVMGVIILRNVFVGYYDNADYDNVD